MYYNCAYYNCVYQLFFKIWRLYFFCNKKQGLYNSYFKKHWGFWSIYLEFYIKYFHNKWKTTESQYSTYANTHNTHFILT